MFFVNFVRFLRTSFYRTPLYDCFWKLNKGIIASGDYEIKSPNSLTYVDIDNMLIFNKIFSGERKYKYLIGYMDHDNKTVTHNTSKHKNICKTLWCFFIEDDELLKRYNDIWNKVSISIKKNLIANPSTRKHVWKPKENLTLM